MGEDMADRMEGDMAEADIIMKEIMAVQATEVIYLKRIRY